MRWSDVKCNWIFCKYILKSFFFIKNFNKWNCSEQENDLERKHALLNREIRAALSVEDWRKTEEQREREALLLKDLVDTVNKRNALVQNLHSQEQA